MGLLVPIITPREQRKGRIRQAFSEILSKPEEELFTILGEFQNRASILVNY